MSRAIITVLERLVDTRITPITLIKPSRPPGWSKELVELYIEQLKV